MPSPKNLLCILVALFLYGCASMDSAILDAKKQEAPLLSDSATQQSSPSKFLSPESVVHQFKYPVIASGKDFDVDSLTATSKKRLSMISSENSFFSRETMHRLDKKKCKGCTFREISFQDVPLTGKGHVDLRNRDTPIVEQWNGTCSAHGLSAAVENFVGTPLTVNLSERHVWDRYRVYSCESAIEAWSGSKKCITLADKWPNGRTNPYSGYLDSKNCFTYLDKTTYIEDNLQDMINSLDSGRAVYIGISVTNSMLNCDKVLNANSSKTGGGHALSIVGYKLDKSVPGGGYIILRNSWGASCADLGYQYAPFSYCQRGDMYCIMWTLDKVRSNGDITPEPPTPTPPTPTPPTPPTPPEKKCVQWKRVWYMPWRFYCAAWE